MPSESALVSSRQSLVGLGISLVCLALMALQMDMLDAWTAITGFHWVYFLFGMTSLTIGYAMRIVRWSLMLRATGANISPYACIAPFVGSIALNNVLPMRAGDLVRALVFPSAIGVGRVTATSSLIMERLIDMGTLVVCLVIGLAVTSAVPMPAWMSSAAVGIAVMGGVSLALFLLFSQQLSGWCAGLARTSSDNNRVGRSRIFAALRDLLGSFHAMSRAPVLIWLLALSILAWLGEAGLFWALLLGFGFDVGLAAAALVMSIATLATLVPSSPGYVGPFHLAAFVAISMLGGETGDAWSFAVLSHLGVWLPTTLAGVIAIMTHPQLFRGLNSHAPTTR